MGKTHDNSIRENFLEMTFAYLVSNGLENTSVRNLCKSTGISTGSVYYWFKDGKDELFIEAAKYGLEKIIRNMFRYSLDNIQNLKNFFDNSLETVEEYKKQLRFICQMATSMAYGEEIRKAVFDIKSECYDYITQLAEKLGSDVQTVEPLVQLYISFIINFIMWGNKTDTKENFSRLYEFAKMQIGCD